MFYNAENSNNFSNLNSTTRFVTTATMMGNSFTGLVRMLSAYTQTANRLSTTCLRWDLFCTTIIPIIRNTF